MDIVITIVIFACFFFCGYLLGKDKGWNDCYKQVKKIFEDVQK